MMSKIKLQRQQLPRLAEALRSLLSCGVNLPRQWRRRGDMETGWLFQRAALFALLLSLLGLANSSLAEAQVVTGVPSMAQRHTVVNFSQLAQREALANLT